MLQHHKVYSGSEFNKLTAGTTFYKMLEESECHMELQYKPGLNVDFRPFYPYGECRPGGLYFTEAEHVGEHFESIYTKYRIVTIPDDAQVYVEEKKFKADKIILSEFQSSVNDEFMSNLLLTQRPRLIWFMKQTRENCLKAIRNDPSSICYIDYKNKSLEMYKLAYRLKPETIKFIPIEFRHLIGGVPWQKKPQSVAKLTSTTS